MTTPDDRGDDPRRNNHPAPTAEETISTVLGLDTLGDLPRTGWVIRGINPAESVAAHSLGVAQVAMALVDSLRAEGHTIDGERVLRMAVLHDAAEAATGDVPMPSKSPALRAALAAVERTIAEALLPPSWVEDWQEAADKQTLESRVVKAADKVQMMVKALRYHLQGRRGLEDFWENPGNFRDMDVAPAARMFEAIAARAGRSVPT